MSTHLTLGAAGVLAGLAALSRRSSGSRALSAGERGELSMDARPFDLIGSRTTSDRDRPPPLGRLTWRVEALNAEGVRRFRLCLVEPKTPGEWRTVRWASITLNDAGIFNNNCRPMVRELKAEGVGPDAQVWSVVNTWMDERLHGRGLGTELYLTAFAAILGWTGSRDAIFVNDECGGGGTSWAAQKVWSALTTRLHGKRRDSRVVVAAGEEDRVLSGLLRRWREARAVAGRGGSRGLDPHAEGAARERARRMAFARDYPDHLLSSLHGGDLVPASHLQGVPRLRPDDPVTIYRSVPVGISEIRPGDWVALSRGYTERHGRGVILSKRVPARHVVWAGTDMNEWFYTPVEDPGRPQAPTRGSMARLVMAGLPRGTTLYHGTQAAKDFEYPDGPAWVSDSRDVAEQFVRWNRVWGQARPRIYEYRVTRRIPRLQLIRNPDEMAAFLHRLDGGTGDLDYATPREMAPVVCDAGYNGWHIPHNYAGGGSDTMLCEPEDWLELVNVEAL